MPKDGCAIMSKTLLLSFTVVALCIACAKYPTANDINTLDIAGARFQFFQQKASNQVMMQRFEKGILTLHGDCFRLGAGGPVVIWPAGYSPCVHDGVVEIHGSVLPIRVGETINLPGALRDTDVGKRAGPVWVVSERTFKGK